MDLIVLQNILTIFEPFYYLTNYYLFEDTQKIVTRQISYSQSEINETFIKVEKPE